MFISAVFFLKAIYRLSYFSLQSRHSFSIFGFRPQQCSEQVFWNVAQMSNIFYTDKTCYQASSEGRHGCRPEAHICRQSPMVASACRKTRMEWGPYGAQW